MAKSPLDARESWLLLEHNVVRIWTSLGPFEYHPNQC